MGVGMIHRGMGVGQAESGGAGGTGEICQGDQGGRCKMQGMWGASWSARGK